MRLRKTGKITETVDLPNLFPETNTNSHKHTKSHVHVYIYLHAFTHIFTNTLHITYTRTHTLTYTHMHIHTYTLTGKHAQCQLPAARRYRRQHAQINFRAGDEAHHGAISARRYLLAVWC